MSASDTPTVGQAAKEAVVAIYALNREASALAIIQRAIDAETKPLVEALEAFARFGEYIAKHPNGLHDELYGWEISEDAKIRQSDLERARAALAGRRNA